MNDLKRHDIIHIMFVLLLVTLTETDLFHSLSKENNMKIIFNVNRRISTTYYFNNRQKTFALQYLLIFSIIDSKIK